MRYVILIPLFLFMSFVAWSKEHQNLDDIYKNADIYLCTSIFEGLSNTILEAMSFCLPIVATNVGDNMYLVNKGKNGFLVEPKNLNQISNALLRFINNRDLLKSYGLNSYNKVKNEYSINNYNLFEERVRETSKYNKYIIILFNPRVIKYIKNIHYYMLIIQ